MRKIRLFNANETCFEFFMSVLLYVYFITFFVPFDVMNLLLKELVFSLYLSFNVRSKKNSNIAEVILSHCVSIPSKYLYFNFNLNHEIL